MSISSRSFPDFSNTTHLCQMKTPIHGNMRAIEYCYANGKEELWVGNYENESQVDYCPFCGYKARTKIAEKKEVEQPVKPYSGLL